MSDCTPLIVKMRDLIKQSHIYLSHAPKHEKYVAVKQIKNLEWDIYLLIIECNKRYFKKTTLTDYKFLIQKLDNHCEYPNHILRRIKQWLSIPMSRQLSQVL